MRKPILADLDDLHTTMATICQSRYDAESVRETEVITSFMFCARNQSRKLKIEPQL
ncbi:hypothetical protein DL93DRAFT_2070997 [Clavulina sp. PMI_390]|nr:hypothetical protein DL93DRAFT_2070997 [Clavulina sp. PMI_390]